MLQRVLDVVMVPRMNTVAATVLVRAVQSVMGLKALLSVAMKRNRVRDTLLATKKMSAGAM